MNLLKLLISAFLISLVFSFQTYAQDSTTVVVRAKAKDAKFIGDGMGGAMITILKSSSGDTLARGLTKGETGNTELLVKDPVERYEKLSTPEAAKFEANLLLEEPTLVTIEATAPYGKPQARVTVSTQQWLIPGKNITGEGIILEVPGFVVSNQLPEKGTIFGMNEEISIRTHIVMMCGCPTSDGGLWDSSEYEIRALIKRNGDQVGELSLSFTGKPNLFETTFTPSEPGPYTVTVYAFHPRTGNIGLDKTVIRVEK